MGIKLVIQIAPKSALARAIQHHSRIRVKAAYRLPLYFEWSSGAALNHTSSPQHHNDNIYFEATMSAPVVVRTKKFIKNPLLARRQMVVEVIHPGVANVSKDQLAEILASSMKASSPTLVVPFGFKTAFGGGKSTGFCVIYDNEEAMIKFEPKYRLVRKGVTEKKEKSRKAIKEAKNKGKKVRGTGRRIAMHKAKRSAGDD